MSQVNENESTPVDPLVAAYRQASELDASFIGARPGAQLRTKVLAHARVVAQSAASAQTIPALSEAILAAPAANESRPVWRMVAGVVLGLAAMWTYQLVRPGISSEASVAVLSPAPSAKASVAESTATPQTPIVVPATAARIPANQSSEQISAGSPLETRPSESRAAKISGQIQPRPAPAIIDSIARDSSLASARLDKTVAVAKPPELPSAVAASGVVEMELPEPSGDTAVAVLDTRKRASRRNVSGVESNANSGANASAGQGVSTAAPETAATPNAFPANGSGAVEATTPSRPTPGSAMSRQDSTAGANGANVAMFTAVRAGNVEALRAALSRGANVSARDVAGRTAVQIARERADVEMLKVLELAGAK